MTAVRTGSCCHNFYSLIFLPMCFSCRHWGASPSSPQYSSMEAIFPSATRIKDVAWKDSLPSLLYLESRRIYEVKVKEAVNAGVVAYEIGRAHV